MIFLWYGLVGPLLTACHSEKIEIDIRKVSENLGFPLDEKTGFAKIMIFSSSKSRAFTIRSSKDCYISRSEWESLSNEELIGAILHEWGHHEKGRMELREKIREEIVPEVLV